MSMDNQLKDNQSLSNVIEFLEATFREQSTQSGPAAEFATVLIELVQVYQHSLESDGGLAANIADFLPAAADALKGALTNDSSSLQQLDHLNDTVIDRWGEELLNLRDGDALLAEQAWGSGDALNSAEAASDDFEAPSADAVQAMLSHMGAFSDSSAESTATPEEEIPAPQPAPSPRQDSTPTSTKTDRVSPTAATANSTNSQLVIPSPQLCAEIPDVEALIPELREAFLEDAHSCLGSLEKALLKLETEPSDKASFDQIQRELHTLKGASGSVGLNELADQIHNLEESLRDDQQAGKPPAINSLFTFVDKIRTDIAGSRAPNAATASDPSTTNSGTESATAPPPAVFEEDAGDDDLVRVKSSQLNRLMDMLAELVMLRNKKESELLELQDVYHELISSVSKMRLLANESELRPDAGQSLQLSEVANDVLETAQHLRDCTRPFADGNASVSRFIRQFRQELVELRRSPISGLFRRLQRVLRDAARAEDKQVRLELVGEDAGIERALQQRLYEPLLHIVRNSVCHGIESPDERAQLGKNREGVVSLEARSGPDLFVIEVRDDGRGLDYEAIRRRGIERGLITTDQVVSRQELSQLIFHPGFSTRDTANQVGGRGIGMDVVAATLQRMRGWLEVDSEPGAGTRIRLSFPLPSVVQHAMVFRSADQLFALPMESVQAAGEVPDEIVQHGLANLLGLEGEAQPSVPEAIVIAGQSKVADQADTAPLALMVDAILGPEELVVRPLPTLLRNHPFCVGASLTGMGQTVLILDARRVLQTQVTAGSGLHSGGPSHFGSEMSRESQAISSVTPKKRIRVLVVDDSVSARKRVVRSLSRYPVETVEARHGKEALELLAKERFTAVFSDLEMPHVDGLELLSQVNSPGRENAPPFVIISSRSERQFTDRAKQLGAVNYLIKPLADQALDETLLDIQPLRHLVSESNALQLEYEL